MIGKLVSAVFFLALLQSCRNTQSEQIKIDAKVAYIGEDAEIYLLGKKIGSVLERKLLPDGSGNLSIRFQDGIEFGKPIGYQVIEILGTPGNGIIDIIPVRKDSGEKFFEYATAGFIGLRFSKDGGFLRKLDSATLDFAEMSARKDFFLLKDEVSGDSAFYNFVEKLGVFK